MNLLLETSVLLWWLSDAPQLSEVARWAIQGADIVYISPVSILEIELKKAKGKLTAPDGLHAAIVAQGFSQFFLAIQHITLAARLPRHHDDLFDRLLVAQASLNSLSLVTADSRLAQYDVPVILV